MFGESAGGLVAVGAFGIVKIEKHLSLLQRDGLSIDGDEGGGFGASLSGLGDSEADPGEEGGAGGDDEGAAGTFAGAGPPSGDGGEGEHGGIAVEEHRPDGALDPGEAGAVGSEELVIEVADVDHEGEEHQADEPGAPAAVAGNQDENTGEDFGGAEEDGSENAELGGDEGLGHAGGGAEVIGEFPDAGDEEK